MNQLFQLTFAAVFVGLSLVSNAQSQEIQTAAPPTAPPKSAWLSIGPQAVKTLTNLVPGATPEAVDLDLSFRQLQAEPQAAASLQAWVKGGGVVLLHTDAARLFGLKTQPIRARTRDLAGQEWGRAVAALPFGAHPLLWAGTSQSLDGLSSGFLGVRTVFYRLKVADETTQFEGDALVSDAGQGVPILRVTDVAPNLQPLYAAAARPYGRGLALFCPRAPEIKRGDGAQFETNLRAFVAGVRSGKWIFLNSAPLREAFDAAGQNQKPDYEPLLTSLQGALSPPTEAAARQNVASQSGLWLQREEAQTLLAIWQAVQAETADEPSAARGAGLLLEIGARLALQKPNDDAPLPGNTRVAPLFAPDPAAREQLFATQSGGAHENATRWWCGVFALAAAIPPRSTVADR